MRSAGMGIKAFIIASLATIGKAHMVLQEPEPFPTDNSPLDDSGSNYPCKVTSYAASSRTEYAAGSTQSIRLKGSATHGGGSCQISITYDTSPTRQTAFKVIHSIEGGCPVRNKAGNIDGGAEGEGTDAFDFIVPADLPAGDAVLAWTWFNRVGNREMYMSCAPITITRSGGGGGDMSAVNKLPDIMVANIGAKMCKVAEGTDVKFPNPGKSVTSFPYGGTLQDVSGQPGCSYNWMSNANGAAPVDLDNEPAPVSDPNEPEDSETTPVSPPVDLVTPTEVPVPATENLPAPTPAIVQGGECAPETFMCIETAFKQCVHGSWSTEMPMAPGTKCIPGVGSSLDIIYSRRYRS